MSKKQQGTYRLAGGITVTDADLEADVQRFEAGECDGVYYFRRSPPMSPPF